MKRTLVLASVALLACACLLQARRIYIPPTPDRLATAACAVIGKVTEIEKKSVVASANAGDPQKYEYQIAVIKVESALAGAQGLTHVRVGLQGPPVKNDEPNRRNAPAAPAQLVVGQEGCFFLQQHHDQPFYVFNQYQGFVSKESDPAGFEVLNRCAKLLKDPMAGLKSKEVDDRFLTAAMLVARYRNGVPGAKAVKTEAIPVEESKLILLALRDADWGREAGDRMSPQQTFARLGLTPQDGWKQPTDFKQYQATAKDWLTKHADSYRIQRYVSADKK
ncbi:MAG: hypothetical protein AB7K24_03570 [Gemmataceae bacterium]